MKTFLILFSVLVVCPLASGIELQTIVHKTVGDKRVYARDATDRRYNVWTDDATKARDLLDSFGFQDKGVVLKKGEVLVVFLNDSFEEDLIQITRNQATGQIFADYADSGVEHQLVAPEKGKKYSHITAVIFTAEIYKGHIGVRGMISNGLSEKK